MIEDRHHGFLQAVLAAPVSRVALVLGKSLGGVAIAAVQVGILLALAPLAGFPLSSMNWPLLLLARPAGGARLHRARLRDGVVDRLDPGLSRRHERRADPAVDAVRRDVPAHRAAAAGSRSLTAPRPDDLRRLRRPPRLPRHRPAPRPVPARSSLASDLAIVAGFAIVALAGAVALCRRRA